MGTKSGLLVALLASASAFSGVSTGADWTGGRQSVSRAHSVRSGLGGGPVQIRVRPPIFSERLPSLDEGFAYVDLKKPVAENDAWLYPPVVTDVDAPTLQDALPKLEEGFIGVRTPTPALRMRRPVRIASKASGSDAGPLV